jgi:hypothetical protein
MKSSLVTATTFLLHCPLARTAEIGQKRSNFSSGRVPILRGRIEIDEATRIVVLKLRAKVEKGGDGYLYGDRSKAIHDLDALPANPSSAGIKSLLLPTANLQQLSIECGWGSEFNELAAELEEMWN